MAVHQVSQIISCPLATACGVLVQYALGRMSIYFSPTFSQVSQHTLTVFNSGKHHVPHLLAMLKRLYRKPVTRYPLAVPDFNSEICTIDFALATRFIPPTPRLTIDRSRSLPLTISSPSVFLGICTTCLEDSGHFVSREELSELSRAMESHLNSSSRPGTHTLLQLREERLRPHTRIRICQ